MGASTRPKKFRLRPAPNRPLQTASGALTATPSLLFHPQMAKPKSRSSSRAEPFHKSAQHGQMFVGGGRMSDKPYGNLGRTLMRQGMLMSLSGLFACVI